MRQKCAKKIPFVLDHPEFYFPSAKSYEQCSSEIAAKHKSSFYSGGRLLDLSGGLGIDTCFLSKRFEQVDYVEINPETCKAAENNFEILGKNNIKIHNCSALEFVTNRKNRYDLIYIDPSRRANTGQRVFRLEDCEPNIFQIISQLLQLSDKILIKAAPILDIKLALKSLGNVRRIDVISIDNDCKEVLYHIKKGFVNDPEIHTFNYHNDNKQAFTFKYEEEDALNFELSSPITFLYEPNSSILKAGAFRSIGKSFGLKKLHANTHLYTSNQLMDGFPGRKFKVIGTLKPNKKQARKIIPQLKANISVRNYPLTVKEIRLKTGLKDGGDMYLFAVQTVRDQKQILITTKIK